MESSGKIKEFFLARKLNPITIKVLDYMGKPETISGYIKRIEYNEPFYFDLSYDTNNLTKAQKRKLMKLIREEQKSGARMLENPSNTTPSTKDDKSSFIPKADGNQQETAQRFLENQVEDWNYHEPSTPSHEHEDIA